MKQKTYKQIEASRNRRLWITSVFMPTATMATGLFTALYTGNQNFRNGVNNFTFNAGQWFRMKKTEVKDKFKRS